MTSDVDPHGLARPAGARGRGARDEPLFRVPDLRHRPRQRRRRPSSRRSSGAAAIRVREVRRTVRQGLWAAVTIAVPIWLVAWNGERILLAHRPGAGARAGRGRLYPRPAMEPAAVPVLPGAALLPGGPRAARLGAGRRPPGAPGECRRGLVLMFGSSAFPALGLVGAGIATTVSSTFMFLEPRRS